MAERLCALEASFLALERRGLPMHIAGLAVLETGGRGPVPLADLKGLIASRMARLPRFHQRVRSFPLGLSRAEWVAVSRIDLAKHVFHHRLSAPGQSTQLTRLCARILEVRLPRDRPLWQIHLIDGLQDGRQALLVKTHHAISDGIGAMELADALLEHRSTGRRTVGTRTPAPRFACATPSANRWLEGLTGLAFTIAAGPVASAGPFNRRVSPRRVFAMATLSMDRVRAVKNQLGVSVDDVLLAAVACGIHRFFERSRLTAPAAMRAMVPASTRTGSKRPSGGNHITTLFIDLPMDSGDLDVCARRVATSKAVLKIVHAGLGMSMLIEAAGRLPAPLHDGLVRFAGKLPVANLVLSDVPGPVEPRFLLGRRISALYPMLPLPASVGVSIASISLGGTIGVGVTADPHVLPNPARLARAIEQAIGSFGLDVDRAVLPRAA